MEKIDIKADQNPRVPAVEHDFHHAMPVQLRFADIDILGHVNNSVYLQLMDLGKSRYFEAAAPENIDWKRVNVVIVNVNVDFYAPAYFHEPLMVATQATSISERSMRLEQRIYNAETGQTKCVGRTVMAGFDVETATSAPIEQAWVEALERFEHRTLYQKHTEKN